MTDENVAAESAEMTDEQVRQTVVDEIVAIKNGPRSMRLYLEICAKCGTCASVCPVYYGKSEKRYNPAERTDIVRRIYNDIKIVIAKGKVVRFQRSTDTFYHLFRCLTSFRASFL